MNEEKPPDLKVMLASFAAKLLGRDALIISALIAVIGYVLLYGADALAQHVDKRVDGGVSEVLKKQTDTSEKLDQHLKDDAQFKRQVAAQLDELQADTRALYKAMMTGRPQPRLEVEAKDGGL